MRAPDGEDAGGGTAAWYVRLANHRQELLTNSDQTVEERLSGAQPDMPPALLPYLQAKKLVADNQLTLGL